MCPLLLMNWDEDAVNELTESTIPLKELGQGEMKLRYASDGL